MSDDEVPETIQDHTRSDRIRQDQNRSDKFKQDQTRTDKNREDQTCERTRRAIMRPRRSRKVKKNLKNKYIVFFLILKNFKNLIYIFLQKNRKVIISLKKKLKWFD